MAVFWRAITGGVLLALLGWGAESQGVKAGEKEVSGSLIVNLGQERDIWRPLIHTTVNLSEIRSIKSSFQLRTFDPEGAIFYGDTKKGEDWFILSLKDGIPMMQISKEGTMVSVAGGQKLNDGKWHKLEVSNQGKFVILEVDGSDGLVVGLQSKEEQGLLGELRLALGGMLIDPEKLIVPFQPQMDACVRDGSWLNLTILWEAEAEELWSCYQDIKPGSFFPGMGLAIFNTSVFHTKAGDFVTFEFWGNFSNMDGTVFSIKVPELTVALEINRDTQEFTLSCGGIQISKIIYFKTMVVTFQTDSVVVHLEGDQSGTVSFTVGLPDLAAYSTLWTDGLVAFGGLLGDDNVGGSKYLTGCLEKIQVQGKDLGLDLADKHSSISSHSCPT